MKIHPMKNQIWILSGAAVGISLVLWYYYASNDGGNGGNQSPSEDQFISANKKPVTNSMPVTPSETVPDVGGRKNVKHAVTKVLSLVSQLRNATIGESRYIEDLRQLAADLNGHELRALFAELLHATPPIPKLEQILVGAAGFDPKTVWEIVQEHKMDNLSHAANIEVLGAIYANVATGDGSVAKADLEKVGDADVLRRAALTRIAARDGMNAGLDIISDISSPFYSNDRNGSVWAITNHVKTSGWNGLNELAEKVASRTPELGAAAVIQPIKAMAELRPAETMENISRWPASEAKSIAGNAAISTIARGHPELALDLTAKFQGNRQEQNNLLLGLQSAFLSINRQDLAGDCARLLKENGTTP